MATTNLGLVTPTTGVTVGQYVTGMNNNMGIIDGITINGKPMAAAITLNASDIGAETEAGAQSKADAAQAASTPIAHATNTSNPHGVTAAQAGAVPTGRTLNGYDLSENRTLDGSDIAITGYEKSTPAALAATDTINEALGKLEALTDEAKLKIATLDKTIADYKTAISELNPNQESTQTATGIGSVAIPKNAGGFVSSTINGLTDTRSVIGDCAVVSRGKNLSPPATGSLVRNGLTLIANSDGSVTINGTATSDTRININGALAYATSGSEIVALGKTIGVNVGSSYTVKASILSGTTTGSPNLTLLNSSAASIASTPLDTAITFTPSENKIYAEYLLISSGKSFANCVVGTQLELGSTSSTYEHHKSSTQYVSTAEELYSVPNGVCDSITKGLLTRRVQKYTLTAGNITLNTTSGVNVDLVRIPRSAFSGIIAHASNDTNAQGVSVPNFASKYSIGTWDSTSNIGYATTCISSLYIDLLIAKGTYANLAAAQTALAGTVIYYQLAVPQEIPVDVSGDLQIYANGSVTVEQKTVDAGLYDSGISVLKTRLPISALTYISKLDYLTGVETPINVSTAVVASGGLSFTHPDLVDGDIVFFEYEFNIAAPVPKLNVSYYDSRYTVLDSVNGKYYRWSVTVASGVPTVAVTEV